MQSKRDLKLTVHDFVRSDERVLVLPFDGEREDVSAHWHHFLKTTPWHLFKKSAVLFATRYLPSGPLKNALLRSIGVKVGKNVFIASMVQLDIQFPELITIEDGAILGMYSHVSTHEVTHAHIRLGKVHIGKNALIGAQATVRSGVTVGADSVVAMRAFVTRDVLPDTLVTGQPERKIVELEAAL
ncbi:MAG TPA: acyltransferase [Pirellulales bacterium]|jgi:acetyltransferase-like isoleucine patch superfamily enzyme|nr:acyltransferase [Pirellulales bacterium]